MFFWHLAMANDNTEKEHRLEDIAWFLCEQTGKTVHLIQTEHGQLTAAISNTGRIFYQETEFTWQEFVQTFFHSASEVLIEEKTLRQWEAETKAKLESTQKLLQEAYPHIDYTAWVKDATKLFQKKPILATAISLDSGKLRDFPKEFSGFELYPLYTDEILPRNIVNADTLEPLPVAKDVMEKMWAVADSHWKELNSVHSNITGIMVGKQFKDGICTQQDCIILCVRSKGLVPFGEPLFPQELEGIAVDVQEKYFFSAMYWYPAFQPSPQPRCSLAIGIKNGKAYGTLGAFVQKDGNMYILSNDHVLNPIVDQEWSVEHDMLVRKNPKNPDITQWNNPNLSLGNYTCGIYGLVSIDGKPVGIDAAIAGPITAPIFPGYSYPSLPKFNNQRITTIANSMPFGQYEPVYKVGATTGLTSGWIASPVHHWAKSKVQFMNQYLVQAFSNECGIFAAEGDSGSLIINEDGEVVGLLHTVTDRSQGVITPIQDVLKALAVTYCAVPTSAPTKETECVIGNKA